MRVCVRMPVCAVMQLCVVVHVQARCVCDDNGECSPRRDVGVAAEPDEREADNDDNDNSLAASALLIDFKE